MEPSQLKLFLSMMNNSSGTMVCWVREALVNSNGVSGEEDPGQVQEKGHGSAVREQRSLRISTKKSISPLIYCG